MTAYIAHDNVLPDASTVTVSSEATGYAGANLADPRTGNAWKPASTGTQTITYEFTADQAVDYFAVVGHTLSDDSSSIKLEYSTDGTTYYDAVASISPTDNNVIFRIFTEIEADYWRVSITCTVAPSIKYVAIGSVLQLPVGMPDGFGPIHLQRTSDYLNNKSEGGEFIGRSLIREGLDGRIDLKYLSAVWVRSNWETLLDSIEVTPLFFCWNYETYKDETVYCWTNGAITQPKYDGVRFMTAAISVDAIR